MDYFDIDEGNIMAANNFALYMFYAIPGIIGALAYKKHRIIGALIGLGIALVAITLFALLMGG